MKVTINDQSFLCSLMIFKELKKYKTVSFDKVKMYLETPEIKVLKKHLKTYGGWEFKEKIFFG